MTDTDSPPPVAPKPNAPEYVVGDPAQSRLIGRWAIGTVVALVVIWLVFRYWQHHANAYDVLHRMYAVCYLAGLGLLAVAWYSMRYARRIFDSRQYPPPGGWVFGKTLVLRGDAARSRGRQVVACAIALGALGLYSLYLPHDISTMLMPGTVPIHVDAPALKNVASGKTHG